MLKPLIAVVGNTGVGKSQFAVELAKALNGEVINGDAMQMYHGLDIVTNKHPVAEREGIPHHLLGTEQWNSPITVQDFEKRGLQCIDQLHARDKLPILVGGTHYYIQSLIAENALISQNSTEDEPKKPLSAEQQQILGDPTRVEAELMRLDPVVAAKFHPNDTRRLRRALEIFFETGKKPSAIYAAQQSGSGEEQQRLRYRVLVFWLWSEREVLSTRLDKRVDSMVAQGLESELKQMYAQYDPKADLTGIWQVLGFRQFLDYLQSPTPANWAEGVEVMKSDTRGYAKKQTKWIKNKLGPFLDRLDGQFAVIDATDLQQWDSIKERGIRITQAWLDGNSSLELVPEHLQNVVQRQRQAYGEGQWVRHRCDACSVDKEVVLMGDDEWKGHLKSKGHRYNVRRLEKGEEKEKERQ